MVYNVLYFKVPNSQKLQTNIDFIGYGLNVNVMLIRNNTLKLFKNTLVWSFFIIL